MSSAQVLSPRSPAQEWRTGVHRPESRRQRDCPATRPSRSEKGRDGHAMPGTSAGAETTSPPRILGSGRADASSDDPRHRGAAHRWLGDRRDTRSDTPGHPTGCTGPASDRTERALGALAESAADAPRTSVPIRGRRGQDPRQTGSGGRPPRPTSCARPPTDRPVLVHLTLADSSVNNCTPLWCRPQLGHSQQGFVSTLS
jgi:hypothetical protein